MRGVLTWFPVFTAVLGALQVSLNTVYPGKPWVIVLSAVIAAAVPAMGAILRNQWKQG